MKIELGDLYKMVASEVFVTDNKAVAMGSTDEGVETKLLTLFVAKRRGLNDLLPTIPKRKKEREAPSSQGPKVRFKDCDDESSKGNSPKRILGKVMSKLFSRNRNKIGNEDITVVPVIKGKHEQEDDDATLIDSLYLSTLGEDEEEPKWQIYQPNLARGISFLVSRGCIGGQDYHDDWTYETEGWNAPLPEVRCHQRTAFDDETKPSLFEGKVFQGIGNVCSGMCADQARDDYSMLSLTYPYNLPMRTFTDGGNSFVSFYGYDDGTYYTPIELSKNNSLRESPVVDSNESTSDMIITAITAHRGVDSNENTSDKKTTTAAIIADLGGENAHLIEKEASYPISRGASNWTTKTTCSALSIRKEKPPTYLQRSAMRFNPCYPQNE